MEAREKGIFLRGSTELLFVFILFGGYILLCFRLTPDFELRDHFWRGWDAGVGTQVSHVLCARQALYPLQPQSRFYYHYSGIISGSVQRPATPGTIRVSPHAMRGIKYRDSNIQNMLFHLRLEPVPPMSF